MSVLDGWWAEAWSQDNGWGIPPANVQDPERRDALEAELIFDTLEEEVIPLYYDVNEEGYSPEWVRRSKRAMMTVIPQFNMRRVLFDYTQGIYIPAARQYKRLAANGFAGASTLAEWKVRIRQQWPRVGLRLLADVAPDIPQGERLRLRVAAQFERDPAVRCAGGIRCPPPASGGRPFTAAAVVIQSAAAPGNMDRPTEPDGRDRLRLARQCLRSTPRRTSAGSSPPRSGSIPGTISYRIPTSLA